MSVFTAKVNPVTGKSEWELQNEDYDYHQEIVRSAFADMLHDTERVSMNTLIPWS
jgi:protein arginine N-methyltransferase 7